MAKRSKDRTIVVYESNTKKLYRLSNGILDEINYGDVDKNSYNVACMNGNNVAFSSIEVPMDNEDEEVDFVINKAYENLNLDIEKDYQISYEMSSASQGVSAFYNVFAVDKDLIEENFKDVAGKIEYIDYLDMEPLAYQAYYSNDVIKQVGIQVFIYMHHNYGTLTLYKDGVLVNYKIVDKFSLRMLHIAHCNNVAERIPENVFLNDLDKYGFDHENLDYKLSLNRVLLDALRMLTNNLSIMLKNSQLENMSIDKIIIGCDRGAPISLMDKIKVVFGQFYNSDMDKIYEQMLTNSFEAGEYSLNVVEFINIHAIKYDICTNIKKYYTESTIKKNISGDEFEDITTKYLKLNPFVILGFLRAKEQLKHPNNIFNISSFLRPPPFAKRYSGKLIIAMVSAFVLTSLYPIYNYVFGTFIENKTKTIVEEIPAQKAIYERNSNEIRIAESKLRSTQDELAESNMELQTRYRLLNGIYEKKIDYQSKTKIIVDISKLMNESKVKTSEMLVSNDEVTLELRGNVNQIIEFLKNIGSSEKYYINSREFLIKQLSSLREKDEYNSTIIIKVRG